MLTFIFLGWTRLESLKRKERFLLSINLFVDHRIYRFLFLSFNRMSRLEEKQRAVQYYKENGVPKQLENLLNKMAPQQPEDVFGFMVRCTKWISFSIRLYGIKTIKTRRKKKLNDCHKKTYLCETIFRKQYHVFKSGSRHEYNHTMEITLSL